ncbi:flagellin [Oceanospirillum linum]|uniref:Flagellin n=1 Tax=Oceanospirillum linum TaxID=966 RepID=A0A1T1HG48_OCELI|nr:flagellin [Oceanospirillum linum]OOV88697.1 hypothetical protein BTA35_0204250 [Oceanospirillum linum]SEG02419.1 flagellin [Oleiphilus messinensis]SMP21590.1 flagellin [Oceanospirillum linum]
MALFVNTNIAALSGQKHLSNVVSRINSSYEKLSSGSRINSAKDDAAGLQISNRLETQITGLNQATRNANDAISIAQIAEGAMGEITNNFQRVRQLAVQGGNRTLSSDDRISLGQEFGELLTTNDEIAERTSFGKIKLLNSESPTSGFQIQTGANAGEQSEITTGNATLSALFGKILENEGVGDQVFSAMSNTNLDDYGTLGKVVAAYIGTGNASTVDNAVLELFGANAGISAVKNLGEKAVGTVQFNVENFTKILTTELPDNSVGAAILDNADLDWATLLPSGTLNEASIVARGFTGDEIKSLHGFATDTLLDSMSGMITQIGRQRSKLGAEQNGITSLIRSNNTMAMNVAASRSQITDTDFAYETAELTRNQIIQQASSTILSQTNQLPQIALSLLR